MKYARDIVQPLTVDYSLTRRVNDCDFRIRRRPEGSGIRIDVRAIDKLSIRRQREITRAAASQQPFDLLAGTYIDHGNVAAKAVRDVQGLAAAVRNDAGGLKASRQRAHGSQSRDIDYRYRV